MKHIFTLLLLCCATLGSRADVVPEGAPVNYKMSAQLVGINGFAPANWIASKVSYSTDAAADGTPTQYAYISGFFSLDYPVDQLWVRGRVDAGLDGKGTITIDCNETALTVQTESGEDLALKMGEITFDSNDNPAEVSDVTLTKDGTHIFLKDDASRPRHILGLYYTHDDIIYVRARMHSPDLVPYEGHVDLVELPATADVRDYVYHTYKWYGAKEDLIGHVAVDGDNYYFDTLLPDVGRAWVKGIRKGNTITLFNDQYLGVSNGFYVYYFGNLVTGVDYENMVNIEEFAEITFSIDNAGKIKLNNQSKANPGAYFPDGAVYGATYNHSLEPYENSDVALVPSAPYDVSVGDEYLEEYGGYVLDFLQDNVSVDGKYIDPAKLGYYIYMDDELFTFRRDEYPYIDDDEMTLVPFGYCDFYNYDFNHQANMNEVYIYRTDWTRIGVQAVYTAAGETKTSPIVYATIESVDGVASPHALTSSDDASSHLRLPSYRLDGRRAPATHHGISICGGKVVIR